MCIYILEFKKCVTIISVLLMHFAYIDASSLPLIKNNPVLAQKIIMAVQCSDKKTLEELLKGSAVDVNNIYGPEDHRSLLCDAFTIMKMGKTPKLLEERNKKILGKKFGGRKSSNVSSVTAVVKMLLEHGINPNGDCGGGGILNMAIKSDSESLVKLLLSHKADCHCVEQEQPYNTPLLTAVGSENVGIAQLLLAHNASPDDQNEEGDTPLIVASKNGNRALLHILLSAQAHPFIINNCGETAFSFFNNPDSLEDFKRQTDKWIADKSLRGEEVFFPGNNVSAISVMGLKRSLEYAGKINVPALEAHIKLMSCAMLKKLIISSGDDMNGIVKVKQLFSTFRFLPSFISELLIDAVKKDYDDAAVLLCDKLKLPGDDNVAEIKKIIETAVLYSKLYSIICAKDTSVVVPGRHANSLIGKEEESRQLKNEQALSLSKEVSGHYVYEADFSKGSGGRNSPSVVDGDSEVD